MLRKDGLIAFLRDSVGMETNYDDLRLVERRALAKELGLQAELISLLRDTPLEEV